MLGEIIKSTEALRYHAKTAEIAGQNLAHVNDENYARQRVLSKEGLMYRGQGGLNTSSLEAGGLDHARNQLLDKRVFAEFAESSNLETQKEILSLLQAALGESINRQPLSGGLDGDHDRICLLVDWQELWMIYLIRSKSFLPLPMKQLPKRRLLTRFLPLISASMMREMQLMKSILIFRIL